jgi:hypothetical protein
MKRPGSFEGLLLESPSIYAGDYLLLKDAASVSAWPRRIYVGTGTIQKPVADVVKLQGLFQRAGLGRDRLFVVIQKNAAHSEKW